MTEIKDYISSLEKIIEKIPYKISSNLEVEKRGGIVYRIKGNIIFNNKSEFNFKEYFLKNNKIIKIGYFYHYQNSKKKLIFRYDNAEHYPEIDTFPNHKHIKGKVYPCQIPKIEDVIKEILNLLLSRISSKKEL